MSATETLICQSCRQPWQRTERPGTKPRKCPACASAPRVRTYQCDRCGEIQSKTGPGPLPLHCPDCPEPPRSLVLITECQNGPHLWVWPRTTGRAPVLCPSCSSNGSKYCPRCETTKPSSAFHVRARNSPRDGLQVYCRECLARPLHDHECPACGVSFTDRWRGGTQTADRTRRVCPSCAESVKWCTRCETVQPRDAFGVARGKSSGRKSWCLECDRAVRVERRDNRAVAARKRGKTAEDWQTQHDAQGGRCALCSRVPDVAAGAKQLAWDHCHDTGTVRKLLCGPCNLGLGLLQDDPVLLRAAADYVESFR